MIAWLRSLWQWLFPPPPDESPVERREPIAIAWGRHLDAGPVPVMTLTVIVAGEDGPFTEWASDLLDELRQRGHELRLSDELASMEDSPLALMLLGPAARLPHDSAFSTAEGRWAWMMPRRGRRRRAVAAVADVDADPAFRAAAADLVRLTPGGRRTDDDLLDWTPDGPQAADVADALAAFARLQEAR